MVHLNILNNFQPPSINLNKRQSISSIETADNKTNEDATGNSYNPFEHRDVKHPNSDVRSLANLLKSSLGSGILAMPLAFKCAGLVTGTIGTIIIGYICTHCAQILVKVSHGLCKSIKKPSLGYAETCEQVFLNGPKPLRKYSTLARHATDSALTFTYLGACCVYVVLIGNSVEQLVENSFPSFDLDTPMYCGMLLVPFSLLVQINNLKYLAPFSALANVFLICVCGISFYFIFDDMPSLENRNLFPDIKALPLFISTVIFAMEGIGVVMPIENEMAKPSHFLGCPGVLNISMSIVVFLYASLGFFGYVKYGDDLFGSITLNLQMDSVAAQVAKIFIIIAILFTYPIQFYVSADITWKYVEPLAKKNCKKIIKIALLTIGVLFTVCIGAALPKIDAIIELVGAIFYSTLGLFVPALIETLYKWENDLGRLKWILWKNILIMIFASVALVCGVTHAISEIMA
ncbi:proton-coupled amino acid transporter-like protein pathetic [Arctopsyche grandis]|uniref:proton-coupled amino acid transporter-like protein pathetic n=1 Tax=Arctopsyche grandis TaxID=121162 RepID=UPI00406D705D